MEKIRRKYNFNIKDSTKSIIGEPNLSLNRAQKLFSVLNNAYTEGADILILPEIAVPFAWLPMLANFSRKQQIAIVCGLEHCFTPNNKVYNLIVTILPFKDKEFSQAVIKVRIKNHYAPLEEKMIKRYGYKVPKKNNNEEMNYDLFCWRGLFFSTYNCYELANIKHRCLIRKGPVEMVNFYLYYKREICCII